MAKRTEPASTTRKKPSRRVTPVVSPVSIAAHIGETEWIRGDRIHEGVFHHALVCARRGDATGLEAFSKLSPRSWWVALLSPKARSRAKEIISAGFDWASAAAVELQFDQLHAVSLSVPELSSAANARILEGLLERTRNETEDELDLDRAFLHLVETDLSRARQAAPWLEMVDDRIVTALVDAVAKVDDSALKSLVALWAEPDLNAELTAEQWRRIAPQLVGEDRFETVDEVLNAVARVRHPELLVGAPNEQFIQACWRSRDLERLKSALKRSEGLRAHAIGMAYVVGAASLQEVMAKCAFSSFSTWETLLRITTDLRELGRSDAAPIAARKQAAKGKPKIQYDTQNWHEVAPRERLAQAFEASGAKRLELAGEAVDLLSDVPNASRARLASRFCGELLALGAPALAVRALSELGPKSRRDVPEVQSARCALIRAVAATSVAHAFEILVKLTPSAEVGTYAAGVMGMRRTSSTGLELSLELLEATSQRGSLSAS
ncbi:MAG: hypothetical protein JNM17_12830 [Archangium sp.]|nr:hypothetical protein [Archangium sp.]